MPTILEETSTITAKGQTTIPKSVRQALGVDYGDKISFRVDAKGVSVHRVEQEHHDPALVPFLALLARDIEQNPQTLVPLTEEFFASLARHTQGIDVDVDDIIEGDVSL
jgi:antitoxin PrlF